MDSMQAIRWIKEPHLIQGELIPGLTGRVQEIAAHIEKNGFEAITEYACRFDGCAPYRVAPEDAHKALASISLELQEAFKNAIANVRFFHQAQRKILTDAEWDISPGNRAGIRFIPMDSVGIYIPGGRYPLPSSAIMGVVPAQAAGVPRIAAFCPPGKNGHIHPAVLAVLSLLEVDEIWALGGVQAIAAMALGAGEIKAVDFISGPGNAYVTEAKRHFWGRVGIDGLAGPSEVLIIADETADPACIAADLLAQAEHDPVSRSILISTDERIAEETLKAVSIQLKTLPTHEIARTSWENQGGVGIGTRSEAIAYANQIAPEHLELAIKKPREALSHCTAYGAAFLGHYSAEVFGDYIAGTNHTLPTLSRARYSGGVWTGSFLRPLTHLELSQEGAASLSSGGALIADTEGLAGHAAALRARGR